MTNTETVGTALNTDREIWRAVEGDAYAPSIHLTQSGGIGINVGGRVYVMPVEKWHVLASRTQEPAECTCELLPPGFHMDACPKHKRAASLPAPERSKEETGVRIKPLEWPDASITNHEAMRAVLEGAVAPAILSIALPDELEVAKLIGQLRSRPGEAITRVERLMDEAADALSQAHSTIAALIAQRDRWVAAYKIAVDQAMDNGSRLVTAEAEVKRLTEEKEGLRDLAERLKLEAQGHASEAKTANSTIYEIYQVLSGGKGEPGNWHGAEPARRYVEAAEARIKALEEALGNMRCPRPCNHRPDEFDAKDCVAAGECGCGAHILNSREKADAPGQ